VTKVTDAVFFFWIIGFVDYFCGHNRGVAQLASALAWGARGRLFESDHPDLNKKRLSENVKASFLFILGILPD
jgi:hypothetical protein